MMQKSKVVNILATVSLTVLLTLLAGDSNQHVALALDESHLKIGAEFREMFNKALSLESDKPANSADELKDMMLSFASHPKSGLCEKYLAASTRARNEYLLNVQDYFSNLQANNKDAAESSLTALKELAKFDPILNSFTQRHQSQANSDGVSNNDLRCALIKYQVANLDSILVLLQTDIKYLLFSEDQDKLNAVIHQQLDAGQTLCNQAFYNVQELTDQQKGLVQRFFSDNLPGFEIDQVNSPGQYVIGRLLDTCQTVASHQGDLLELAAIQPEVCPGQWNYYFDQHDAVFEFCQSFINV